MYVGNEIPHNFYFHVFSFMPSTDEMIINKKKVEK